MHVEMQVKAKLYLSPRQELRSWEEKLTQAALQQKCQEEALRRREQELAEREIHILERELNIIIHQLYQDKPHVERRQGKFRRSRLKLKDGNRISLPSGETAGGRAEAENGHLRFHWSSRLVFTDFQHKITVQASPSHERRRSLLSSGSSPPTSPALLPRLRAIQRERSPNLLLHVSLGLSSHLTFFTILLQLLRGRDAWPGVAARAFRRRKRRTRGGAPGRRVARADAARTGSTALMPGTGAERGGWEPPFPKAETKAVHGCFRLLCGSVKPPHEGSRQRSCSAPNLRRSPRHSPAVPGVPCLVESGKSSFFLYNNHNHNIASWRLWEG